MGPRRAKSASILPCRSRRTTHRLPPRRPASARAAFAVALRVDGLHQCSAETTPYISKESLLSTDWYQGTAIAILDINLELLDWTWLINSPTYQIAPKGVDAAQAIKTGCIPHGFVWPYYPPIMGQTNIRRAYHCGGWLSSCYLCLPVMRVFHLTGTRHGRGDADGGLTKLRVWSSERITYQHTKWIAGRNQALFLHTPTAEEVAPRLPRQQLFVQPRLGMIGELGRPRFERGRNPMRCMTRSDRSHLNEKGEWTGGASNCRGGIARGYLCGTHADGDEVPKLTLAGLSEHKAVLRNDSRDRIAVSPLGRPRVHLVAYRSQAI